MTVRHSLLQTIVAADCRSSRPPGEVRMTDHPQSQVGWLGTGRMGSMLVRRLLVAGLDVSVNNRTKAKAQVLAADGAKVVDQAADLARARVVFVMVGTSQDLIDALLGSAGLLAGEQAPAV